jgi:hypothetical protein
MLVTFLKDQAEANVVCTIPKLVDRIFLPSSILLNPASRTMTVIRLICLEVDRTSPGSAHHLVMVMPEREVTIVDISDRMLQHDYTWMKAAKEFAVLDHTRRHIRWDGLPPPVRIARGLNFELDQVGRFAFVKIFLNEPVGPGERLGIALRIQSPRAVEWESLLDRRIELSYFWGRLPDELIGRSEIPCLAWYGGSPQDPVVNGGFDVFLAHSRKHRFSSLPPEPGLTNAILPYNMEGRPQQPPQLCAHGWKLRHVFPQNPQADSSSLSLSIRGLLTIVPPIWLVPLLVIIVNFILAVLAAPLVREWFGWHQP